MSNPVYLLTTCLNAAATIDRTIWGVVSQEGPVVIRYHVQDAGSTDGTLEKLAAWQSRLTSLRGQIPAEIHFTFSSRRDGGMYEGIRNGFDFMEIPDDAMMGWCNADDVLWQGALSQVGRVGREFPEVEWLTGWASTFDEAGTFISVNRCSFFPRQLLAAGLADGTHWHYVQQESTFWRKRLWDRAGGVDPTFQLAGDWDLWRRFAQHAELFHLDRQLGAFHFRRGQKSGDGARYQGECTGRLPAEERLRAYQALLRQTPTLGVQRLSAGPDGKLRRSEERRESMLSELAQLRLFSARLYFRRLGSFVRMMGRKRTG